MLSKLINHIFNATRYSFDGILYGLKDEYPFRIEFVVALLLLPASFLLADDHIEFILLLGSTLIVLIVELLNSAIEAIADRISTEHHPLAKKAKDYGSAAVFFSLLLVCLTWFSVLRANFFQ